MSNPLLIPLIVFLATVVRSTFGFGEALVAVPLLALLIPVEEAVPLATLLSVTVAAIVIIQDWRHVHFTEARRLVIATLFGLPPGLLLLTCIPEEIIKALLGVLMIGFSLFCLLHPELPRLSHDRWASVFGFLAGIQGGAYGMNGPPLVIYGTLRHWSPEQFRATLQGYFLPASLLGLCGYGLSGLWTSQVNHNYLLSLPGALIAIWMGGVINRHLHPAPFRRAVHLGLILLGIILLVQSLNSTDHAPPDNREKSSTKTDSRQTPEELPAVERS